MGEKRKVEMTKALRSDSVRLQEKRRSIDLLDERLLKLINRRLRVALEIGKIKKRTGKKVYDPAREKEVLERLKVKNKGPVRERDLKKIFGTVMKICRQAQG